MGFVHPTSGRDLDLFPWNPSIVLRDANLGMVPTAPKQSRGPGPNPQELSILDQVAPDQSGSCLSCLHLSALSDRWQNGYRWANRFLDLPLVWKPTTPAIVLLSSLDQVAPDHSGSSGLASV